MIKFQFYARKNINDIPIIVSFDTREQATTERNRKYAFNPEFIFVSRVFKVACHVECF